jgi:[ribosomal protein S18]-alanine N-acetyltransferase
VTNFDAAPIRAAAGASRSAPLISSPAIVQEKYNSSMPKLSIRIRNYQPEDLDALYAMDQACFAKHTAFSKKELRQSIHHPHSVSLIAERSGVIVGFVVAQIMASYAHILTLDVSPQARREQIAATLMQSLHEELSIGGVRCVVLEVSINNEPARSLYEKLDYEYIRVLPGYYSGREDAYQMIKTR